MSSMEAAETKFAEQASTAHATFVDLNLPMAKAVADCEKMLAARVMLMGMYGMNGQMVQGAKGKGKGGGWAAPTWPAASRQATPESSAKSHLMEAIQSAAKEAQTNVTKGQVVYETTGDKHTGFTCTLSAPDWFPQSYVGESKDSKKAAESSAAMQALQANYPEWVNGPPGGKKEVVVAAGKGRSATRPDGEARPPPSSKNEVIRLMQRILGRSLTKDDVVFTDTEGSSTLTFPNYPDQVFSGEHEEQREAQMAAASAALKFLVPIEAALPAKAGKASKPKKRKAPADGEAGELQPPAKVTV